jgi:hypothetical protein
MTAVDNDDDRDRRAAAPRQALEAVDAAVNAFLEAATVAGEALEDFAYAWPFLKWLDYQALPLVEDYEVQIEECADSVAEIGRLLEELRDEAAALDELLSFLDQVADEVDAQIGAEASAAVKDAIARFIDARLEPLRRSGRQLGAALRGEMPYR